MVIFNEIRLSDDKDKIIVDCSVEDLSVYSNVYIESIYIDYYKNNQKVTGYSDKAIQIYNNTEGTLVKTVRTCLSMTTDELKIETNFGINSFDDGMFYIFVYCGGTPSAEVATMPCGYDEDMDVAVVLDWQKLYEVGMSYIAQYSNDCTCAQPAGLDNFILSWNALKLASGTCDYALMSKLYDKLVRFYSNISPDTVSGGCSCGK